mmetsp:Transcript_78832/g.156743  ORF Transcript_78832/g.156743 Transcript_78832/m.156743 type:complete len:200 (+) Transcript_78832:376-975(+)
MCVSPNPVAHSKASSPSSLLYEACAMASYGLRSTRARTPCSPPTKRGGRRGTTSPQTTTRKLCRKRRSSRVVISLWKLRLKKRGEAKVTRLTGPLSRTRADWQSRSSVQSVARAPPREWPVMMRRAVRCSSISLSTARRMRPRGVLSSRCGSPAYASQVPRLTLGGDVACERKGMKRASFRSGAALLSASGREPCGHSR